MTPVVARLPYVDPADAAPHVREVLERVPPLRIFRMLANAETAFRPFMRFGGAVLGELELDPALRELAILRVAQVAEAEYEWVQHVPIARQTGVSDEQIAALERGELDAPCFSAAQRAVLGFTGDVVRSPRVGDEAFTELTRHLSAREVVELLLTVGEYLMLARVMTVLEIELDAAAGSDVVDSVTEGTARAPSEDRAPGAGTSGP